MLRHIEVLVDRWPIGHQNRVHTKGERVFIDSEAARILVGMGKCAYVDDPPQQPPAEPPRRRTYRRRDMRAEN